MNILLYWNLDGQARNLKLNNLQNSLVKNMPGVKTFGIFCECCRNMSKFICSK